MHFVNLRKLEKAQSIDSVKYAELTGL